jgi:hypothetical protein
VELSSARLSLWSLCQATSLSELASPELASRHFATCCYVFDLVLGVGLGVVI